MWYIVGFTYLTITACGTLLVLFNCNCCMWYIVSFTYLVAVARGTLLVLLILQLFHVLQCWFYLSNKLLHVVHC